jgi:hypothetical protein
LPATISFLLSSRGSSESSFLVLFFDFPPPFCFFLPRSAPVNDAHDPQFTMRMTASEMDCQQSDTQSCAFVFDSRFPAARLIVSVNCFAACERKWEESAEIPNERKGTKQTSLICSSILSVVRFRSVNVVLCIRM